MHSIQYKYSPNKIHIQFDSMYSKRNNFSKQKILRDFPFLLLFFVFPSCVCVLITYIVSLVRIRSIYQFFCFVHLFHLSLLVVILVTYNFQLVYIFFDGFYFCEHVRFNVMHMQWLLFRGSNRWNSVLSLAPSLFISLSLSISLSNSHYYATTFPSYLSPFPL